MTGMDVVGADGSGSETETEWACLNGELLPVAEARIPIWDRGFLFGDAVYEVFRLYRGRCWLENEHLLRLERSLQSILMAPLDRAVLMERVHRVIERSKIREGIVYIHITRGVAPRKHAFPRPEVPPTELIVVRPVDVAPIVRARLTGVKVITQPDLRWKRCDIKSTNLLANVLAQEAAVRAGGFEAVLVDELGRVTEATHSSLMWVKNGRLEATPEGDEILPGTTRQAVVNLAKELGVPFAETTLTSKTLREVDELLLSGTTCEVMPVVQVDDDVLGDGQPGPVSRRLQTAFENAVAQWLTPANS